MDTSLLIKVSIVTLAAAIGTTSLLYFKMKPHNMVEQVAEFAIKEETGQDVDLSVVVPNK
jgi:hypothetical protein